MYPAFFYALRKPPAGRVGAYRIRPPTHPGIWSECVFLVLKHRFIVIQAPFKRHSNSALRAVGEGHQGCQPRKPEACGDILCMYPAFLCPAEASGRQGRGVSHTPPPTPVYGANACSSCSNTVSSPFKYHSNVIQIRSCGPSVRAYAIRPYSGTRIMYPAFLAGVPDASGLCRGWEVGRVPQKPVPSKLRRRP